MSPITEVDLERHVSGIHSFIWVSALHLNSIWNGDSQKVVTLVHRPVTYSAQYCKERVSFLQPRERQGLLPPTKKPCTLFNTPLFRGLEAVTEVPVMLDLVIWVVVMQVWVCVKTHWAIYTYDLSPFLHVCHIPIKIFILKNPITDATLIF